MSLRDIPAGLLAHLQGDVTQLCRLWRVQRKDGVMLFFTDLDVDVVFDGDTYRADIGFSASAVLMALDTNNQGLDLTVFCDDTGFSRADLENNVWSGAQATVSLIAWSDSTLGEFVLFGGTLGEAVIHDGRIAEMKLAPLDGGERFIQTEIYSASCRADLGDAACKVDIEALRLDFTVVTSGQENRQVNSDEITEAVNYWNDGLIVFDTGANTGLSYEIAASAVGTVYFYLPTQFPITVGDTAHLYPGCAKTLDICRDRYDNVINFRGEPFVPGEAEVSEETGLTG